METRREAQFLSFLRIGMRSHQERAEGRRERQRVEQRDGHGDGHGKAELRVEGASDSTNETHGNEHSHEHEGGGDQRRGDAMHGTHRGIVSRTAARIELRLHRLDDNDGIVDHGTNHEHQCEEGEHIEREANEIEHGQRTHQRNHDGDGGNHRGTETLQEEVDHQDHQQHGLEECPQHVLDRGVEEVLLRLQVLDDNTRGQVLANLLHLAVNLLDDLVGIRARHLIDHDVHARMSVGLADKAVALCAELHLCHVADAQHVAIGQRPDHHLLVALLLLVASTVFQHILERVFRVGTQRSGGRLHVLLIEHLVHIGRSDAIAGHLLWVEPDTHRVVGADDVDVAHPRDTRESRFDIDFRVVGQESAVESAVGTIHRELLDVARLSLAHRESAFHHIAWQPALHGGGTVLHIHHGHVGVGTLSEEDGDRRAARVGCRRRHIHHALHAVDGLLEGHHHTSLHRLGIGARIVGVDANGGRRNLGKLLQRKACEADDAQEHHQHGDDARQNGPVDECPYLHIVTPSFSSPAPSATIVSPTCSPSSTIYSRPLFCGKRVTGVAFVLPSTTLYTKVRFCNS